MQKITTGIVADLQKPLAKKESPRLARMRELKADISDYILAPRPEGAEERNADSNTLELKRKLNRLNLSEITEISHFLAVTETREYGIYVGKIVRLNPKLDFIAKVKELPNGRTEADTIFRAKNGKDMSEKDFAPENLKDTMDVQMKIVDFLFNTSDIWGWMSTAWAQKADGKEAPWDDNAHDYRGTAGQISGYLCFAEMGKPKRKSATSSKA